LNIDRQSYAKLSGIKIVASDRQFAFGIDAANMNWSELDNVSIDMGGSNGCPF
jgi:hypothetical protein